MFTAKGAGRGVGIRPSVPHPRCCTATGGRLRLKCDGTRAETRFLLSAKRTSPFKSTGVSLQSTTGSRGVRISGSNAGYTMFQGSVKSTGYLLHSPVFPYRTSPCVITFQLDSNSTNCQQTLSCYLVSTVQCIQVYNNALHYSTQQYINFWLLVKILQICTT